MAYGPVFLTLNYFAVRIASQWPHKFLVVKRAYGHLARGGFSPDRYAEFCDDPCWRVVVNHILKKANYDAETRRTMLIRFQKQAADMSSMVVMVNREKGVVQTFENGQVRTQSMASMADSQDSDRGLS